MLTERQEKILNFLVQEYISNAEPVSSKALQKACGLSVCGATIRNDLQDLTKEGYIEQPHTSAGRIPTKKAYRYFVDKINVEREQVLSEFIVRQISTAHEQMQQELRLAQELMESMTEMSSSLTVSAMPEKEELFEILIRMGPSRTTYNRNIDIINKIINDLENF